MDKSVVLRELKIKGWSSIAGIKSEHDLIEFANAVGQSIPHSGGKLVHRLQPSDGSGAVKGTFSHKYGLGKFPLHTDTAFWDLPARYIILSSIHPSDTPTLLFDTTEFLKHLDIVNTHYRKAIYVLRTRSRQIYCSFYFRHVSEGGIRFDSSCMFPYNHVATLVTKAIEDITSNNKIFYFDWFGETAVIIDNWRMLHGRDNANKNENRTLLRIYLKSI